MKKIFNLCLVTFFSVCVFTSISYAQIISLLYGWNLKGITQSVNDFSPLTDSECIDDILVLRNESWLKQSLSEFSSLSRGEGFWILANKSCELETILIEDIMPDPPLRPPTPPSFDDNIVELSSDSVN